MLLASVDGITPGPVSTPSVGQLLIYGIALSDGLPKGVTCGIIKREGAAIELG